MLDSAQLETSPRKVQVNLATRTAALRADVAGEVLAPDDPGYEQRRKVWNGDFDCRPAMIVRASCVEDVVVALAFARANGFEITVRGCGHSFSGQSVADGALMIDLRRMDRVSVDPEARRARVQGGANWSQVDRAAQAHGLAVTAGQVSHTGVAGLTLGGGLGYLMRAHGLTIDHLVSAEVVTADGRVVRASAGENEDLFFGLRGGGGNFGIVTEFEFQLHPVGPIVLGGELGWSRDQGPEFFRGYVEFLANCPDELMTTLIYLDLPPLPFVPRAHRGKPGWMVSVCGIDRDKCEAALAELRKCGPPLFDAIQPMPYLAIQSSLDDIEPYGTKLYGKSHFFHEISEELLLTLQEQFADLPSHETKVFSLQMGGAVARVSDDAMAFTGRKAAMAMMFEAEWKDDSKRDRCVEWVRRVWSATEKFAQGTYNNFDLHGDEQRLQTVYGADKYRKLQLLKAKYDPQNIFHRNHNITPADGVVANAPVVSQRSAATMMRVAHLVIHAYDMEESAAFYRDVLGFAEMGESTRTPGARALVSRTPDGRGQLELDLVPNSVGWKLPNPYHFALESDPSYFEDVYATLKRRGAKVLSAPPPQPNTGGYGELAVRGTEYRRFLFVDPTLVYHELMTRTSSQSAPVTTLRVNHLIVGAHDVATSAAFYASLFGFKDLGENPHAEGARTMVLYSADYDEVFEIVVHPYDDWLLPNPSQVSLEVDRDTFDHILAAADRLKIIICAEGDRRFRVVDPSNTRIEILTT
ncbi:MAG TPA: FAD-binding protein [Polyangiales bacterium]|nr:FAD-binding protein [Polyangiales bacterium]